MQIRHLAVAAIIVLPAHVALAQGAAPATARNVVPTFGFSVGTLAIDPAAASSVGDRAWGFQLDGGMKSLVSAGMQFDLTRR